MLGISSILAPQKLEPYSWTTMAQLGHGSESDWGAFPHVSCDHWEIASTALLHKQSKLRSIFPREHTLVICFDTVVLPSGYLREEVIVSDDAVSHLCIPQVNGSSRN